MTKASAKFAWRSAVLAGLLLSTAISSTLLSAGGAYAAEKPLIIARNLALNSLDPQRTSCDTCNMFMYAVYETLVRLGDDNKTIVPALAEKWEANADNTQFTFHLNPKAVFADGTPVEAKDVKWSWDRLANLEGGMAWLFEAVTSIDTPDAHTVVVKLSAPDSEFLGKVIAPYAGIVNSTVATAHGAKGRQRMRPPRIPPNPGSSPIRPAAAPTLWNPTVRTTSCASSATQPIGTSRLRSTKSSSSRRRIPSRRRRSWRAATSISLCRSRRIPRRQSNAPDVTVETVPSYNFLYMALSPGAKSNKVPLSLKVRQAIAYAINYQSIIDFTIGGAGKMVPVAIPNGFPGTDGLPMPES